MKSFDSRVWQPKPKWVIEAGALSLSNAQFASLSATSGQCTFQVQVPSTAVYMDRLVNWTSTISLQFNVTPQSPITVKGGGVAELFGAIVTPGLDFALCASPIHSLVTSLQAAIGDTQVTNNLAQTRELLSLLADSAANRNERTQPSYLDTFQNYYDAFGAVNNPLKGWESSTSQCTEENGSSPIQFWIPGTAAVAGTGGVQTYYVSPAGAIVPGVGAGPPPLGVAYDVVQILPYGIPTLIGSVNAAGAALATGQASFYPVQITFTSIEPLQLSPFIYQEIHERQTGLAQLQNVNIIGTFGEGLFMRNFLTN